jgi:hypothetical protein
MTREEEEDENEEEDRKRGERSHALTHPTHDEAAPNKHRLPSGAAAAPGGSLAGTKLPRSRSSGPPGPFALALDVADAGNGARRRSPCPDERFSR